MNPQYHLHQITSDATDTGSLCMMPFGPSLKCFPHQIKHAVHSGNVCDACVDFYTSHREYFDNISPPWNEADEAMAFGDDLMQCEHGNA